MKNLVKSIMVLALIVAAVACSNTSKTPEAKYIPVVLNGSQKWSILDVQSGEIVAKDAFKYAPSQIVNDMFYVMNDKHTYDYYNVSDVKKPVNKESYGTVTEFSEDGFAMACVKGKKICVINTKCEQVAEMGDSVIEASRFNNGLALVRFLNQKMGYINTKGEFAIPAKYDVANPFPYCGYTLVANRRDNPNDSIVDYSFIDTKGTELFSSNATVYNPLSPIFDENVIPAQKAAKDTVVYLDSKGNEVANPFAVPENIKKSGYDNAMMMPNGKFLVVKGGKMGVVDKDNKKVFDTKYLNISMITNDRYLICEKEGVSTLVDGAGKPVGNAKITTAVIPDVTKSSSCERGYLEVSAAAGGLLMHLDEQGYIVTNGFMIPKGVTFGQLDQYLHLLDPEHPEALAGNNSVLLPSLNLVIGFNSEIVTKTAEDKYTINSNLPVAVVITNTDMNPYDNKTESQIAQAFAANIGKTGFVTVGNNVFESENGTAVSLGYKDGILAVTYYMDKTQAKPQECVDRK